MHSFSFGLYILTFCAVWLARKDRSVKQGMAMYFSFLSRATAILLPSHLIPLETGCVSVLLLHIHRHTSTDIAMVNNANRNMYFFLLSFFIFLSCSTCTSESSFSTLSITKFVNLCKRNIKVGKDNKLCDSLISLNCLWFLTIIM